MHLDASAASVAVDALAAEYRAGHLRAMTIAHEDGNLAIPDFALEIFDHCELSAILQRLDESLA